MLIFILIYFSKGGAIDRWEDPGFRNVYAEILKGNWKAHDPYDLQARLNVNSNIYKRPGQVSRSSFSNCTHVVSRVPIVPQSSIFRTFQGWLAMR